MLCLGHWRGLVAAVASEAPAVGCLEQAGVPGPVLVTCGHVLGLCPTRGATCAGPRVHGLWATSSTRCSWAPGVSPWGRPHSRGWRPRPPGSGSLATAPPRAPALSRQELHPSCLLLPRWEPRHNVGSPGCPSLSTPPPGAPVPEKGSSHGPASRWEEAVGMAAVASGARLGDLGLEPRSARQQLGASPEGQPAIHVVPRPCSRGRQGRVATGRGLEDSVLGAMGTTVRSVVGSLPGEVGARPRSRSPDQV